MKAEKFRKLLEYLSEVMLIFGIYLFMVGVLFGAMFGVLAFTGFNSTDYSLVGFVARYTIIGMIFTFGGWIASSILSK